MRNVIASRATLTVIIALALASCGGDPTSVSVSSLRFVSQPTTITPGQPFDVTVELLGANGNRAKASDQVTITAAGATLSGATTVAAQAGLASFTGLIVAPGVASVQLSASAGGLAVSGAAVPLRAAAAALANSSFTPGACTVSTNVSVPLVFNLGDAFGNSVVAAPISVASSLAGVTLTPSSGTTTASGGFSTSLRATTVGSAPIVATVDGNVLSFPTPFVFVDPPAIQAHSFPGTATGTISPGPCTSSGFPSATYRFTMPADGGASFSVTSTTLPAHLVTTDPSIETFAVTVGTSPGNFEWLLPAGTYRYAIFDPQSTGGFSVTSSSVPANTGTAVRGIVLPGTLVGQTLGDGDRLFSEDNSFLDFFLFQSSRACTIAMRSTALDAYLFAVDPATGAGVTDDDSGGGALGSDALISKTSCTTASGPVLIAANTYFPEQGAYTLTITLTGPASLRSPADTPVIAPVRVRDPALIAHLLKRQASKR